MSHSLSTRASRPLLTSLAVASLFLSIHSPGQAAEEQEESSVRLSGFATLGLTHNDNGDAGAISSVRQKHPATKGWSGNLDSVLGVQVDWLASDSTSVLLQGVARGGDDLSPELRMGYLRQKLSGEVAMRLGRIRSPLYFDSDVAEIGYGYLMVRPPLPIYSIANNVSSLDGGDLQWRHRFGNAVVLMQGYYGQDAYKHRFYNLTPAEEADVKLRDIGGLGITAFLPNITLHASHTLVGSYTMRGAHISQLNAGLAQMAGTLQAIAANPFLPPGQAAALTSKAQQIRSLSNPFDAKPVYTSLGFDASVENWRFLGEWTRFDSQSAMVGKYNGWQLTVGHSFENLTPYVSYARHRRIDDGFDSSALNGTGMDAALDEGLGQLKAGLDNAAQFANLSMKSISVGTRYDFRDNMAIKFQFDHLTTPGGTVPGFFAVSRLPMDHTVNLFTVTLDMVF